MIVFPTPVPEVVPRPTLSGIKVKFGVKFDIFGGLNPNTEPKFSRLLVKNGSESVYFQLCRFGSQNSNSGPNSVNVENFYTFIVDFIKIIW